MKLHLAIDGDQAHWLGGIFVIYVWALLGAHESSHVPFRPAPGGAEGSSGK